MMFVLIQSEADGAAVAPAMGLHGPGVSRGADAGRGRHPARHDGSIPAETQVRLPIFLLIFSSVVGQLMV